MLHVRDCSGLLSNGDICPFPWCRKVKHLLFHLVSCEKDLDGKQCTICSPPENKLSPNLAALVGLNTHRRDRFRERMKAVLAKRQQLAAAAAVARASSLAKEKVILVQSGNRPMNPPHHANNPTFAESPMNPQRNAHFIQNQTLSQQQQVGPSFNHISVSHDAASTAGSAAQSSTTPSTAASTNILDPSPEHHFLPSPALSAALPSLLSSLSVSALTSLEEAALELGDISISTSDLIGLSSPSGSELAAASNVVVSAAANEHAASTQKIQQISMNDI